MTEIQALLGLGVLKVLVLLATAASFAWLLRRRSARLRAVLWAAVLVGALVIPIASPLLPKLALPLPTILDTTRPPAFSATQPLVSNTGNAKPALTRSSMKGSHPGSGRITRRATVVRSRALLALWVIGMTVALAHLALSILRIRSALRTATVPDDRRWNTLLDHTARRIGLSRSVRLLISPDIEVPATVGVLKPSILIPMYGKNWNEDLRLTVLLHELIHIQRLDWPIRILARFSRAIYWFIPLTWWAVRRLDLEQEMACDEEVLALGARPTAYADHLISIARSAILNPAPPIPGMAMARTPDLEKRIMTLLNTTNHRRVGIAVLIPAIILVATIVSALAALTPSGSTVSPASPPKTTSQHNEEIEKILEEMKVTERELEEKAERIQAEELALQRKIDLIEPVEIDEEAIAEIEEAMKPHLKELEMVQLKMDELHGHLEKIHAEISPRHEAMEEMHRALKPLHKGMAQLHIQMEPLHRRMEVLGNQLDGAIINEISGRLRSHLGVVTSPGSPFDEAARRIAESARIRIQDTIITIESPLAENREILRDLFGSHRIGAENAFEDAISAAAEELEDLRISTH